MVISYVFHGKVNSFKDLNTFIKSIEKYPPPVETTLVISLKALDSNMQRNVLDFLNTANIDCELKIQYMPDEGFDLGTHLEISNMYNPEILVMISAKSWISSPNWYQLLTYPFVKSSVGIVGSMYTLDSQKTAYYELAETQIRIAFHLQMNEIHNHIANYRKLNLPNWSLNLGIFSEAITNLMIKTAFIFYRIYRPIGMRNKFPVFPNPSLRSTGLAIRPVILKSTIKNTPKSKMETFLIESGPNSLSKSAIKLGFEVLISKPSGSYCKFPNYSACSTFGTIGSESIITDKTAQFIKELPAEKQMSVEKILTMPRARSIIDRD